MRALFRGLQVYTTYSPFRRGRGAFIRPMESLKRRGWPAPLVTTNNGGKMEFEPSLLGWTVFERGAWEPHQSALLISCLRPGAVVINVGANTGYYALLAAAVVGASGKVHAFEIQPEVLRILKRNVVHNNVESILTVVAAGCWSSAGDATIEQRGDPGSARLAFHAGGIRIPLTTIDSYAAATRLQRVDFMMIDAEGADLEVLKGALEVLARYHPIVLAESHHLSAFGSSEADMCRFMARFGYSAEPLCSEFSRDVLFRPPSGSGDCALTPALDISGEASTESPRRPQT